VAVLFAFAPFPPAGGSGYFLFNDLVNGHPEIADALDTFAHISVSSM
jgi:hypothetical protein